MKEKTLLVLAAGMGSRFGGLKQIEAIGPNGEFIIDYSIYDAIRNGFNKVVFIIKKENYEVFKETVGKRVEKYVKVEYAFQTFDDLPSFVSVPENRVKPFGTAHAMYCARKYINGPFAVISSDDFYGPESFELLSKSLDTPNQYSIIGYKVANTITENGSVKRGIIFKDENDNLITIKESKVEQIYGNFVCEVLNQNEHFNVSGDHLVSMLMYGFQKDFIDHLEEDINVFFKNNLNNLEKCEYFLPDVMNSFVENKNKNFKVINTPAKWYGMTYKEDEKLVKDNINNMIEKGIYKKDLWS